MKILFLSSRFPYPVDTGGKIRIYNLVRQLAKRHEVTLLSFSRSEAVSIERIQAVREICDVRPPVELGPSLPGLSALRNPRWNSAEMRRSIRSVLEAIDVEAVVAAEVLAGYYAAELRGIPRILDNCELTVLRERNGSGPDLLWQLRNSIEWARKSRFTRRLVNRVDACTVVSTGEWQNLVALGVPTCRIEIVPNGVELHDHPARTGAFDAHRLIYAGSLKFHANRDAIEHFATDVLPLVRRRNPKIHLRVTGETGGYDEAIRTRAHDAIQFTGHLADVRAEVVGSGVCVVPLRVGGGTRLKILEAMALGVPVISTSKGAEGLNIEHGRNILIADTSQDFADAVVRLVENRTEGIRLARNARRLVETQYDWSTCVERLHHRLEELRSAPTRRSST